MYVCICKGVTDGAIREAVYNGAERMRDLKSCLGVTEQCGLCACHTKEVLDQSRLHNGDMHDAAQDETCFSGC